MALHYCFTSLRTVMWYPTHIPLVVQACFPSMTWKVKTDQPVLFLSFDDGPTPDVTSWVVELLEEWNATATFFCIGANAEAHPEILKSVLQKGHYIGNHTQQHLNGWKTETDTYVYGVNECAQVIDSNYFRPPYGRLTRTQRKHILRLGYTIVMWDVLSGDFDESISGEQCAQHVIKHASAGSIVVFHDSVKAFPRLKVALPLVLEHFTALGYRFEALPPL